MLPRFQLFGFGHRRKLVYQSGRLSDVTTGKVLQQWPPGTLAACEPAEYRVTLRAADGAPPLAVVEEDEEGVWLTEGSDRRALTRGGRVRLPRFDGHPRAALLRRLHGELLVNVMPFGPVPNLLAYPHPWYRDAASMLMCFEKTGNLPLVEAWVMGLEQVFDRNNAGIAEADNPGQLLYMLSLFPGGRSHRLVDAAIRGARKLEKDGGVCGLSDHAEHPVYQTKWLKYGLHALGLDDPYRIPAVPDSYGALFWMDYRDAHVPAERFDRETARLYPYLAWAEAHFHGEPPPEEPADDAWPLTWEERATEACFYRLAEVGEAWVELRLVSPHTWHAAEMFLYYLGGSGA